MRDVDRDRRLSVAMLIQGYLPRIGGAERQLASLVPLLAARGIDVHVVTRRFPDMLAHERVGEAMVHRIPIPGPKPVASLAYTAGALATIRRLRPDVVHAFDLLSPTTTAMLAQWLLGTPAVAKVLGSGSVGDLIRLRSNPLGGVRLALIRRRLDAFVVISDEVDAELAAAGVPAERRVRIPNGVDARRFAPAQPGERDRLRRHLGLPDAPLVVFSGRLAPEKRLDHLLDVWRRLRAEHPEAVLAIIGTGPEQAALQRVAPPGVLFPGLVDDVVPWLQSADIFVLPSAAEGLSNALLEALATGLAAVATAVGGAGEAMEDGLSGRLVPAGDDAALLAALRNLLAEPATARRLGQAGRQRVMTYYRLETTADQLVRLYAALASPRGSGPLQQA